MQEDGKWETDLLDDDSSQAVSNKHNRTTAVSLVFTATISTTSRP